MTDDAPNFDQKSLIEQIVPTIKNNFTPYTLCAQYMF